MGNCKYWQYYLRGEDNRNCEGYLRQRKSIRGEWVKYMVAYWTRAKVYGGPSDYIRWANNHIDNELSKLNDYISYNTNPKET